ncbi:MAG TPA: FAD-dependent oxidoreductase [Jatrophihabitans sp.]|jgi:glycine/D-amino acid oxidase-like deaminating enzyme|nr:FAD-dependent oxidoreductase [Jatrophihabitans sp.]
MRIVVVGGGVIGLLTAVECVRAGAQVDLVEQAAIPSPAATSYDQHRVIRTLHRGDRLLSLAAAGLHEAWAEVERRLGGRFYHRTGVLTLTADIEAELALLTGAGVPVRALSGNELTDRFPQLRFAPGQQAILEPAAGTVLADRALLSAARWLRGHPAVRTHSHCRVTHVTDWASVGLAGGRVLSGDSVVVAAGPWSRDLLPAGLGTELSLKRQTMLSYAPVSFPGAWSRSPAVLGLGGSGDAWLMPPIAGTPVRLSASSACRTVPDMSDHQTPIAWRHHLIRLFGTVLTAFEPLAVTGATEGYYLTDEAGQGPLLVQLADGVWAFAACGGMSFKFGPVLARALADRALGRLPRQTGLDSVDQPRQLAADRQGKA